MIINNPNLLKKKTNAMKKFTKKLLLFSFFSLCAMITFAQERTITGTIKDNNGAPLANASVLVKGTNKGVPSDANGNFSIAVSGKNPVLVISSVNFKTKEISVGTASYLDISLQDGTGSMQEVVVTALGIQKQKRSLGYSIQEVKGQTLVDARETNLVNDLSGKVAGLQVVRSGNGPAGSSQIVLRGNNSLTGLSQPLIVVDGVPMDNSTGRVGIGAYDGFFNSTLDMG